MKLHQAVTNLLLLFLEFPVSLHHGVPSTHPLFHELPPPPLCGDMTVPLLQPGRMICTVGIELSQALNIQGHSDSLSLYTATVGFT